MALVDGLVHQDEGTVADDPDAQLNKAEWNKAHLMNKMLHIVGGTAEPARPASGILFFSIDTGVTPNHRQALGFLVSDVTVPPFYLFDVTT